MEKWGRPNTLDGYRLFHEGSLALSKMESNGVKIDVGYLDLAVEEVEQKLRVKEASVKNSPFHRRWRKRFGERTNFDSPAQLGTVLKESGVEIAPDGLTETGRVKTDEESLTNMDLPFVRDVLEVRKIQKTLNTYLKGIRREVDSNGFLHPSYNLASGDDGRGGAESYRSSSNMPNAQNVPKRNKLMEKLIRPCFVARDGRHFVEVDFSGVEVRVSACYNEDPNLIRYIEDPSTDMHRDKATELFLLKKEEVCKATTRDSAKNMWVFPQFYGSVYFQCAPAIWDAITKRDFRVGEAGKPILKHLAERGIKSLGDCSPGAETKKGTFVHHCKQVERLMWDETFPVYTQWKKDWYDAYRKRGWFPLYTGFVCSGYYRRNQVLNFSVQGSAFHCLLFVINRVTAELKRRKMKSLLVGQIHDSLLGDVPPGELQDFLELVYYTMTVELPKHWKWIIVPIEAEADVCPVGGSWFDKQEYIKDKGVWRAKA